MRRKFYFLLIMTIIIMTSCVKRTGYRINVSEKDFIVEIIEFNKHPVSFNQVMAKMKKNNLRSVTKEELYFLMHQHANLRIDENNVVIALDTTYLDTVVHNSKIYNFPCFYGNQYRLDFLRFETGEYEYGHSYEKFTTTCLFAVIRKD